MEGWAADHHATLVGLQTVEGRPGDLVRFREDISGLADDLERIKAPPPLAAAHAVLVDAYRRVAANPALGKSRNLVKST